MKKICIFLIILTGFLFSCKNSASVKEDELELKNTNSSSETVFEKEKNVESNQNNLKDDTADFDKQAEKKALDDEVDVNEIKTNEKPLSW